ncbi:hypothetical protein [Neobacillus cucumis]|uniref:hypothetical protein n=1 Tax=Neobacillus cucumis TaxID=1740721 RepID=UPI0028530490|nr:hypothetical protein [Neobacillus cucumis]MDR4948129.1 hypothetical protein [Neobacillus cucumis]
MNKIERLVENLARLKRNLDRLRAAIANNTRTDEINVCFQNYTEPSGNIGGNK